MCSLILSVNARFRGMKKGRNFWPRCNYRIIYPKTNHFKAKNPPDTRWLAKYYKPISSSVEALTFCAKTGATLFSLILVATKLVRFTVAALL